jgi:primosomal protein N' (replication factor Y)
MIPVHAYIEVAVALPVFQTFTYGVPENLCAYIATAKRVLVPFGQRRVTGYILGPADKLADTEISRRISAKELLNLIREQ